MYFIWFAIPILVWIAICKTFLHVSLSWGEVAVQAGVTTAIIAGLFFAAGHSQTRDQLFANGVVSKLEPRKESCPWGWRSMRDHHCTEYRTRTVKVGESCSTFSNSTRTCTPIYDTEYNYIYDWERRYFVYADYLEPFSDSRYEISRVDRQGVTTPPRFTKTEIGDPVSKLVEYTNYIKGASSSLFAEEPPGEDVVIAYPKVEQQWLANRVLVFGTEFDSNKWRNWNQELMQLNADIRESGANVVIMVTGHEQQFAEMLARAWEAHNINDVVVTIGTEGDQIDWVDVRSWSGNSLVDIEIRDGILDLETVDTAAINAIIKDAVMDNFELKSMQEFEYLADDIVPPTWVMILTGIILVIVTPAITYLFHNVDLFPQSRYGRRF
jgi:hypothetical protein